ncbi:hypothetical protein SO802_014388 [Lithocarpus litseifolius]|uniref:Uncharacterized protein n=1 Tax=Lithocarpus litseifolius TaxID=425828 RepID=A0AAW2CQT2_9ROSI
MCAIRTVSLCDCGSGGLSLARERMHLLRKCEKCYSGKTTDVASVRPHISDEQEDFIRWVTKIPLEERKCWDLITLDTLHLYCGGPELTPIARRLNAYSRRSSKAISKGAIKRKGDGKDDRPPKKASTTPGEKVPKKLSPPKHGAGKGLMSTLGPVTQDSEHRLLTHKEYAVEMLDSIIKDKDVDPCVG